MRRDVAVRRRPFALLVRDGDRQGRAPVPGFVRPGVQLQRLGLVRDDFQTLREHGRQVELRIRVASVGAALEVFPGGGEVLHGTLAVERKDSEAVVRGGEVLRRGGFESALSLGEILRDGYAPHVHVPQVKLRERVALVGGSLKVSRRGGFVAVDAVAQQPAVAHVPLRLRDPPRGHVLLHHDLRVAVLNLLVADPPGVPLPVAKTSGFARQDKIPGGFRVFRDVVGDAPQVRERRGAVRPVCRLGEPAPAEKNAVAERDGRLAAAHLARQRQRIPRPLRARASDDAIAREKIARPRGGRDEARLRDGGENEEGIRDRAPPGRRGAFHRIAFHRSLVRVDRGPHRVRDGLLSVGDVVVQLAARLLGVPGFRL